MAKYKVKWKLEGSYIVDSEDVLNPEVEVLPGEELEAMQEAISEDPFVDVNPVIDGKETIEVERAS